MNGLPEGVDKDTYFKMAVLQRLEGIENKINPVYNINIKIDDISDEIMKKIASLLGCDIKVTR
jgi:hypothetical protein